MKVIEKIFLVGIALGVLFFIYQKVVRTPSIFEQPAIPEPLLESLRTTAQ